MHRLLQLPNRQLGSFIEDGTFPHGNNLRLSIRDKDSDAINGIQVPRKSSSDIEKQNDPFPVTVVRGIVQWIIVKHDTFPFVPVIVRSLGQKLLTFVQPQARVLFNIIPYAQIAVFLGIVVWDNQAQMVTQKTV